nr:hypothetical protein Iba_scaffold31241CG0010 [Ipomoea batatas]GMD49007.1 hypothetical protein Iba_chr10fCG11740 [Ipomoea batatas]GME01292.1 hypothetical protein Iba_scaffold57162CG0010 [Ipomoea batatas]
MGYGGPKNKREERSSHREGGTAGGGPHLNPSSGTWPPGAMPDPSYSWRPTDRVGECGYTPNTSLV